MQIDDDRQLAERMVAGDVRAFDEFFNRYFDRLYRFALIRVDRDPHMAEDIVQQTFCRAMQKIGLYRAEAALFTWLCRICRNTIADVFRARDRRPDLAVPFEDSDEIRTALETLSMLPDQDPEAGALSLQIRHLVQVVLDHLPTRYGDALALRYIEGLSTKEIGARMRIGTKAAESLLGRARIAFRDAFVACGHDGAVELLADK